MYSARTIVITYFKLAMIHCPSKELLKNPCRTFSLSETWMNIYYTLNIRPTYRSLNCFVFSLPGGTFEGSVENLIAQRFKTVLRSNSNIQRFSILMCYDE